MPARFLALVAACLLCSGCFGTYASRASYDAVGRYPGLAVYVDARCIAHGLDYHGHYDGFRIVGLLSIIPDLVVDTVLLPVDLIAWPFGCKRDSY